MKTHPDLTPELTATQRGELEETVTYLAKLVLKFAAVHKTHATLAATRVKALAALAKAEKAADEGDVKASTEALGRRDQLLRLKISMERAEQGIAELLETAKGAARIAKEEIRVAHQPLVEKLAVHLEEMLLPYFPLPHQARAHARDVHAVGDLQHFARALPYPPQADQKFESPDAAVAALESLGATVAAILEGKPVLTLPEAAVGGFTFPAYCR